MAICTQTNLCPVLPSGTPQAKIRDHPPSEEAEEAKEDEKEEKE